MTNLSEIIHKKTGKNCYMEKIEYPFFIEAISEKLEELKSFCNGSVIHDLLNIQIIILNQLRIMKKKKS